MAGIDLLFESLMRIGLSGQIVTTVCSLLAEISVQTIPYNEYIAHISTGNGVWVGYPT